VRRSELLPAGWTEDQLAEMHNGSLLMSSRLEDTFPAWEPDPKNATDPRNKRRAFARSDDGGKTWAEIWFLADRQPEIQSYRYVVSEPKGISLISTRREEMCARSISYCLRLCACLLAACFW
jgi:Neuraminidase (sialidase)